MAETLFNSNFEYEAPQFFDFHNIQDEEEEQVDSWFDGKPDDEGGIMYVKIPEEPEKVVPIDSELPKPKDSKPQTTETVDIVTEEFPTDNEACKSEETRPKEDEIQSENMRNSEKVAIKGCEPEVENNEPEVESSEPEVEGNEPEIDRNEPEVESDEHEVERNKPEVESNEPEVERNEPEVESNRSEVESNVTVASTETQPKERSKIVTSWDSWNRNKPNDCRADADIKNDHTQTADGKIPDKDIPKMVTRAQKRNNALNISASSVVPSKKQKETPDGNKGVSSKRTRSLCSNPEKKMFHLTKPVTPECLKRQKTNRPTMIKLKTTEEMEMERIAKMRKQTRQHIKANESSMKKAITSASYHPVRMTAGMTQPQEFHFETEKRVKPHPMTTQRDDASKEFLKSLRQHPQSPTWKHRGATVPKPFNLSGSNDSTSKRKRSVMEGDGASATDSYQSMAYQVYKFQTTTPPRFRTKKATNEASCKSEPAAAPKITCPKTPNLATSSRARPVSADVLSKEEQEEQEAQAIKNYHFKAKPFDRRVVEYEGLFGVKRCKVKQLTETEPFSFESDERSEARKNDEAEQDQEEDNVVHFKALPQPNFEKVFRPQLKHKRTAPKPFSFEEKDKERWQKKECKIQGVYKEEEKLREFKALPLPTDSPDALPAISSKSCTSFKPFALNTENRGAVKAEKWIQKVKTELEEERKKTVFKAQPSKVAHAAAFEPQRSSRALTEVSEFALNTDRRALRWEDIAAEKNEVKQIVDEMAKEREVQREEEEKEAIAELRKKLVHKAQPIHKYKKLTVKPSDRPLTQPASPAWSEMKRRRVENYMR